MTGLSLCSSARLAYENICEEWNEEPLMVERLYLREVKIYKINYLNVP